MTIYDFIGMKDECHRLTSPRMNAVTLVSAVTLLENVGDRAVEIRMNQRLFSEFACNAFTVGTENNVYERAVSTMKFMNAEIVIDNSIEDPIAVVKGNKDDGMSIVKVYIGLP